MPRNAAVNPNVLQRTAPAAVPAACGHALARPRLLPQSFGVEQLLNRIAHARRQLGLKLQANLPLVTHPLALGDELLQRVGGRLRITLCRPTLEIAKK